MELVITVVSSVPLVAGFVFNVAAGIGVLRLPDVYTRLHAFGLKDTMGSALTLGGLMLLGGFSLVTVKLLIVLALLWFTCAVATHAVARAAFRGGVRPVLVGPPEPRGPTPVRTHERGGERGDAARGGGPAPDSPAGEAP